MKKQINDVKVFHESFGIEHKENPTLNDKSFMLRFNLMREENEEFKCL